jgi:hypothetical protein
MEGCDGGTDGECGTNDGTIFRCTASEQRSHDERGN